MMWHTGTFKYAITDTVLTNQNAISTRHICHHRWRTLPEEVI